jgi:Concanavalin A-like lectin/glucanases superfamily
VQFGRYYTYAETLKGQLDDIAFWNRALTEQEINSLIPGRASVVFSDAPGAWSAWSLDEGPGPVFNDTSGSGAHGTLRNGPTRILSTAPIDPNPAAGTAIRFDGVNDVVEVAHNSALNAFPLTVTAWVKVLRNTPDYFGVVNKYFGGSGNGYSLHIQDGRVYAWYFNGAGSYVYAGDPGWGGTFVADGKWHHLALVIDASGGRLYVDGVQTTSLGWIGGAPSACTTTIPLTFGKYPTLISLPGRMDEVTLWNRSLSDDEIGALMRFGATGAESGLIGYWPFDNGAGSTASDVTGHSYNGILQNGASWVPSDAPLYP